MANGEWRMKEWRMADEGMANGEWRMREWRMKEWRMAGGEMVVFCGNC